MEVTKSWQKLAENLDDQIARVKNNKASLIIIDGGVGEGKTTLMIQILDYINFKWGLPPVDLSLKNHPQLAMGGVEFTRNFKVCYDLKLPAIGYDEAGDFNKRGSLSRFNAMLNRVFETFRGFKIIVVVALPTAYTLDSCLFDNNIPRLLLHLQGRSQKLGNFSGYSLSNMNWIRYWADKLPKGAKYKCYQRCDPNFYGHFKNLEPARSLSLDVISTKGKMEILNKQQITMEGLVTIYEISKKLGVSLPWIRAKLRELNIKNSKAINRIHYYDENIISMLNDHIRDKDGGTGNNEEQGISLD